MGRRAAAGAGRLGSRSKRGRPTHARTVHGRPPARAAGLPRRRPAHGRRHRDQPGRFCRMTTSFDGAIVPITLTVNGRTGLTLWAPPWEDDDGEEWQGFLGDGAKILLYPSVRELADFIASGEENDLSDHPAWGQVQKLTPDQLRPGSEDAYDLDGSTSGRPASPTPCTSRRWPTSSTWSPRSPTAATTARCAGWWRARRPTPNSSTTTSAITARTAASAGTNSATRSPRRGSARSAGSRAG